MSFYRKRLKKLKKLLLIVLPIVLIYILCGCQKNYTINNYKNETDKDLNALYDNIIDKIYKDDMPLEFMSGHSRYIGYQLYDRDFDGINELYIYRIHDFDGIKNGMISKPFIYEAYKVENGEPVLFLNGEPRGNATCDNCYFALNNGQILHLQNSHSTEDISLIDTNDSIIEELHCDYAYVTGNPDHDVYKINDKNVSKDEYQNQLESINSKIGYFSAKLY